MNNKMVFIALGFIVFAMLEAPAQASIQARAEAATLPYFETVIEQKIYRGGQPTDAGFRILASQGIKTIVNLRGEWPPQLEHEKMITQRLGMFYVSVPMGALEKPNEQDLNFLEQKVLSDTSLYPIFVHCLYGRDRTGLVIGLYRVYVQKPALGPDEAYAEMEKLGFRRALKNLAEYFFVKTGYRP